MLIRVLSGMTNIGNGLSAKMILSIASSEMSARKELFLDETGFKSL